MIHSYSKGTLYGKIKYLAVKKTEKILRKSPCTAFLPAWIILNWQLYGI
jgi:hypothetical protein